MGRLGRRWPVLAIVAAGLATAAMAFTAWATCDCAKLAVEGELARLAAGLSFVFVGAVAVTQRGTTRVGFLMTGVGLTWFLDDMGYIYQALPYTVSRLTGGAYQPLLAHLAVAFPSGLLRSRLDRAVVGAGYGLWALASLVTLAFWDAADAGCPACPPNLLLVHRDLALAQLMEPISGALALVMTLAVVALLTRHWAQARVPGRRALAPVLWALAPLAGAVIAYTLVGRSTASPLAPLALTALPIGFLVGLLQIRLNRAEVGRLIVELGDAAGLRAALARRLHDPSLQVVYWLAERGTFVDAGGAPVSLPNGQQSAQVATLLEHDGAPIAALIHDATLRDDPDLIETAAAAARLAIDNERLQAEIRVQLQEVRASRARIVEAADAERRRIERNLHDGSQQRLVALSLALSLARARLGSGADDGVSSLLDEASNELGRTLSELRELARGIHPAVLTEAGLGPALQSLADRQSLPVALCGLPIERFPSTIEAAAYYVVAEALTNIARHARARAVSIDVGRCDGHVTVEVVDDGVGGAHPVSGSGLRGLADRVGALDGQLEIISPPGGGTRVRARIPCE